VRPSWFCWSIQTDEDPFILSKDDEADDFDRLAKECPVLNAAINETMRLYPPVPSGVQRVTPAQGLTIKTERGPIVIPGNINISIPTTTIHRDPRYFSPQPESFRPERWIYPEKEKAFDKNAFIPFGYGPTGCVGKSLAWMEMRLMLATILRRFELSFAPDFDYRSYPDCIKDAFTMARTESLPMVLKKRKV
jgi:cytochrome P450